MFNLLTPEEKELLRKEYASRRITVVAWIVFLLAVGAIAMLAPSYIVSKYRLFMVKQEADLVKASLQGDAKELEESVNRAEKVSERVTTVQLSEPSVWVTQINDSKPAGTSITHFSFSKNDTGYTAEIQGLALTRDGLLAFERALKASKGVSNVVVPIVLYTKESNIPFTISFVITK